DLELVGVDRYRQGRSSGEPAHHRLDASYLLDGAHRHVPRTRRLAADIEHVCALSGHAETLRYSCFHVGPEAVPAERARGDVDDAHDVGSRAPLETPTADFGNHDAIILRQSCDSMSSRAAPGRSSKPIRT